MIKRPIKVLLFLLVLLVFLCQAGPVQYRAAWLAWAGTNVPSRDLIAQTMDELAEANFNAVHVDVWRYGYPYFRSDVFFQHTGYYTDPSIEVNEAPERDVLAEMIAEAHRAGLEVVAWFEAGFNAGISESSPLNSAHPDWLAKTKSGSTAGYGQAGPALIHTLPEVRTFLIELCREVVFKYDIDGIEFDRVRYPSLDCGYDTYTKELYKSQTGSYPPTSVSNSSWIRWRADDLTDFVAELYDSVKAMNPDIMVSNAPLPWGYEQFCQDYAPWVDGGYLDMVVPQMYTTSSSSFSWRMNTELAKVNRDSIMYPGISTVANGSHTTPAELTEQINLTAGEGLGGNVIWYHAELIWHSNDYLNYLKNNIYTQKAELPFRDSTWRPDAVIIEKDDSSHVMISGDWTNYSGTNIRNFYNSSCLYTPASGNAYIEYSADILQSGIYDVYFFQNIPLSQASSTDMTECSVFSDSGIVQTHINQKVAGNAGRWQKVTSAYFSKDSNKKIIRIQAPGSGSGNTFADAVMLLRSRNPFCGQEFITDTTSVKVAASQPENFNVLKTYPNPFNPETCISFSLKKSGSVSLNVYSVDGSHVACLADSYMEAGDHRIRFNASGLPAGIYICRLNAAGCRESQKMILTK